MANPPRLITEEYAREIAKEEAARAVDAHERRFGWLGVPLIVGVVAMVAWWG